MSRGRKCQTALLLLGAVLLSMPARAESVRELQAVVQAVDKLWFGQRSTADVSMTVKTENYERVLKLTYWVEGKDQTLIRITAPAKEKGTSTLKSGKDIYNYLPKISRTIKVSAALRSGSWMGSHFTNDDLLKATRFADDYTAKLLKKAGTGAAERWTIELTPKPATAVPWSKVVMELNKATSIPSQQEFFDDQSALIRTITFADVKDLGGRTVPSLVRVTPADKPTEYTELHYEKIDRTVKFDGAFFSLSRLKNP